MVNEVTAPRASALPAHLQGKAKEASFGNIDSSDLIIPRVKLLQSVDDLVVENDAARAGEFWHTILGESLGKSLIGIPLVMRKTQVLWAPRGDDRGILARSRDAIHWDPPEGKFEVKFQKDPAIYVWKLAPTVMESGLDKFGSSRPGDPNSAPAAALTYEILWWFPDLSIGPAIILNSRGSVKVCKGLLSMIDAKPTDHYNQLYAIGSRPEKGPDGENYFAYTYRGVGYADEADCETAASFYNHYKDVAFRASDEREDSVNDGSPKASSSAYAQRTADSKF